MKQVNPKFIQLFGHVPKHALERELSIHLKINKQYSNLFDIDAGRISD